MQPGRSNDEKLQLRASVRLYESLYNANKFICLFFFQGTPHIPRCHPCMYWHLLNHQARDALVISTNPKLSLDSDPSESSGALAVLNTNLEDV